MSNNDNTGYGIAAGIVLGEMQRQSHETDRRLAHEAHQRALNAKQEELDKLAAQQNKNNEANQMVGAYARRLQMEVNASRALLSKPFLEEAERTGDYVSAYEKQMEVIADWMVSQKAFKELAVEFGFEAHGYTPEQVIEMGMDKKIDVLQDKHDPSHRTNVGDSQEIGPRKEALIEKYHKDKAARKAKKGS